MAHEMALQARLRLAAEQLSRTRVDIDNTNPNRIPIKFWTKNRWSEEIQIVWRDLTALLAELATREHTA